MPVADIGGLIALNGIAAQLTALTVIVLAFILLCRVAPREDVVLIWTAAWAFALIGMGALFVRFLLLPDLDHLQLSSGSRASNVLRWGGDEFLCVCTRHTSGQLRDRIERALSTLGPVPGLSGMRVEVSVGSVQRSPEESLSRAIDRADRAMYEQKFRRRESGLEQHSLFSDED